MQGIRELCSLGVDHSTTFLGTIILTSLADRTAAVVKGEDKSQPTAVQVIIDGQQRLSTLAILAIQLTEKLKVLHASLPGKAPYSVLQNHSLDQLDLLQKLFTVKLGRGSTPPAKPKIVRAKEDRWIYEGPDDRYGSPVGRYIAAYIRTGDSDAALNTLDPIAGARVRGNVVLIDKWLDAICDAHLPDTMLHGQFPVGQAIVTDRAQEYVLGFRDRDVARVIAKVETNKEDNDYSAAAIYQIFVLTYYPLRRSGVNCLKPAHEEWGFDMFQALNATGTPLTAMETFLPEVMQAEHAAGNGWDQTLSREYMDEIDELFATTRSNEQKGRRTNELLGTFALCYDGEKLGNKFSAQRRWLSRTFEKVLPTMGEKHGFLRQIGRVATFYRTAWYMEDTDKSHFVKGLEQHPEGPLASLAVQHLKDANSALSAPVLARFYSRISEDAGAADDFVEVAKACAAFCTLWRSASSTSGLDDVYRRFFRGSEGPVKVDGHSWKTHPKVISPKALKQYFQDVLHRKGLLDKDAWVGASERILVYTEIRAICRFVLFVAGHDRVADAADAGLSAMGKVGVCPLLSLERWTCKDHKSLEHVAPQRAPNSHDWDPAIYTGNRVHDIGNLILLPTDINKFVDNKDWAVKFLHYSHLGARKAAEIQKLSSEAKARGIVLSKPAINALAAATYNCAVEPVLELGAEGVWNADLIDRRSRQLKELAFDQLRGWLT